MSDAAAATDVLRCGALAIAAIVLALAALNDIATRTIPDLAPVGLIALGVAVHLAEGNAIAAFGVAVAVFLLGGMCWRCGWLGGGDVKLLAACAWLVQPKQVPQLLWMTGIAGAILACLYLALSWVIRTSRPLAIGRPQSLPQRVWRVERWRIGHRAALPYGCAIAVGTLVTLSGR